MTEPCPVLLELLAEIPDFRQAQGRPALRHPCLERRLERRGLLVRLSD
ncbi:MAG: hypothetical protein H0T92_00505 [Pyrinomonadaceae bacterium]|nr:hypothetical protein [Pyrinomonadaceae bacterium]